MAKLSQRKQGTMWRANIVAVLICRDVNSSTKLYVKQAYVSAKIKGKN